MNEIQKYHDLLHEAARLHERWRANCTEPFNVFTALRSASDEVNLHSRFLHALLNYIDPASGYRENLKAFLHEVVEEAENFQLEHARVEREANNIDLLISNGRQAVIVENKIWAADQIRQLQRYRDSLVKRDYTDADIRILYLTLDGHEPDPESLGEIPQNKVQFVSYGGQEIQDWLTGCQRRAFNEPGLRESIAQYIRLIRRMTNTDYEGKHMDELKKLLMQGGNLVVASQLSRALFHTEAALVRRFYLEIDSSLRDKIKDLPKVGPNDGKWIEEETIRNCILGRHKSYSGLCYEITKNAGLKIESESGGDHRLSIGVSCVKKEAQKLYSKLESVLAEVHAQHRSDNWNVWKMYIDEMAEWRYPNEYFKLRDSNVPSLKILSEDVEGRAELVEEIASKLKQLWDKIKEHGIVD